MLSTLRLLIILIKLRNYKYIVNSKLLNICGVITTPQLVVDLNNKYMARYSSSYIPYAVAYSLVSNPYSLLLNERSLLSTFY